VKRKVGDPSVSHIVAGQAKDMWDAIKSISSVSSIPVEIIAVVEDSTGIPSEALERYGNVKVVVVAEKSNRATKYNIGARHASHRHLIFSSGEIEILDSDYPIAILEHTQRSEIGAVGVKLIYPDGRFYHTGMILGINGVAGYAYRNVFQGPGHWRFAVVIRNFSAVSWDLMGVDKNKYEEAGGFDEQLSAYADIDFCLKLIRRGYRNLYTPYVAGVLKKNIHSLEALRDAAAERVIMGRYGEDVCNDPCYHPLCTKGREDFTLDWDAHRFDYRSALESMARFNP
jgi:GT2 family glycosyltransferase